VLMIYVFLNR